MIRAVFFGNAIQPMPFIGGETDTLVQRQFKAALVRKRQQMRFQGILLTPGTPTAACRRPAASDLMHVAGATSDHRIL